MSDFGSDFGKEGSISVLLKVSQVAERLGVSTRTVWRLTSEGRLPQPVAIGRCKRWRRGDVDGFIAALKND